MRYLSKNTVFNFVWKSRFSRHFITKQVSHHHQWTECAWYFFSQHHYKGKSLHWALKMWMKHAEGKLKCSWHVGRIFSVCMNNLWFDNWLIHQPTNALNKIQFMTSIKLLHVFAPVGGPTSGVFENKGIKAQHIN